jgi:DNA-binding response OmpR family regulator
MDGKVMVVDDNADIRAVVKELIMMKEPGLSVVSAGSGREAMAMMRQTMPDLVLLDLAMPEMSGWEVASAMRADSSLTSIPIIFLTAKTDEMSMRLGETSGEDFIIKPFESEDFMQRVKNVLIRGKMQKDTARLVN